MAMRSVALGLWLLAVCLCLSDFAAAGTIDEPRYRVGVLPYPGVFSLLTLPEPTKLGEHRYGGLGAPFTAEQTRGLLYSCRAGFLDLAHIRKSADWTRYFALEFNDELGRGARTAILKGEEPSRYHLTFHYPSFWSGLGASEKHRLIDELSIRLGQHMALLSGTWHEIITFFGYSLMSIVPETRSSFTYDDMTAHMVGVDVGGRALRDTKRSFDDAVTRLLNQDLTRLDVVSAADASIALYKVKGKWWSGLYATKRDLQTEPSGKPDRPWLVRDLTFCKHDRPVSFRAVGLSNVRGRNFAGFVDITIEPNIDEADQILPLISPKARYIRPRHDFPIIMAHIRKTLVKRFGKNVDRPYP